MKRHPIFKILFLVTSLHSTPVSAQIENSQLLQAQQKPNGRTYIEWTAENFQTYKLYSSLDSRTWTLDSTWTGFGHKISLLVHQSVTPGHTPTAPLLPALPLQQFSISTYPNHSLVSWTNEEGTSYQAYLDELYFSEGDQPLFTTTVTDPSGDYSLFLQQGSVNEDPSFSSLTIAALPAAEQATLAKLTNARAQILSELSPTGGTETLTSFPSQSVGSSGFYRLVNCGPTDTDGDGLYDELEADFGTSPYDPDTDNDGVTDPWDHANLPGLIISEFMASNSDFILDEDGDDSDWIEIFNPTSQTVDFSNPPLVLKDKNNNWNLPTSLTLAPGESLRIFASGKNRTDPSAQLHTNFKLSSEDDSVILTTQSGTVVDDFTRYGVQRVNASAGWGLDQESGQILKTRYFLDPTPGALNSHNSCGGFTQPPIIPAGQITFDTPISIQITPLNPGDIIYYTLDNSNPDDSLTPYDGSPIVIDSTTIVRAISVNPGCIPSAIVSRSYLFKKDVIGSSPTANDAQTRPSGASIYAWDRNQSLNSAITINGRPEQVYQPLDYEMDPLVLSTEYSDISQSLSNLPSISISLPMDETFDSQIGFYTHSNSSAKSGTDPTEKAWKRLATVEYIDPNTPQNYTQETCEIQISGGASREHAISAKHNFRMTFEPKISLSGNNGIVFENSPPLENSQTSRFQSLMLRATSGDGWAYKLYLENPRSGLHYVEQVTYLREAWTRAMHRKMNPPTPFQEPDEGQEAMEPEGNLAPHRQWVHLYLNGLYWGVYEMGERVDEEFAKTYSDPRADYDIYKQVHHGVPTVVSGSIDKWNELVEACKDAQTSTDAEDWKAVTDLLDLDNFIDYMILNLYIDNTDWPHNNWRAIRRRTPNSKFRFLVWDAEQTMWDQVTLDSLARSRFTTHPGPGQIMDFLIDHTEFKKAFKERVDKHFHDSGGAFSINSSGNHIAAQVFADEAQKFLPLVSCESARWGDSHQAKLTAYAYSDPNYRPGENTGDWLRNTNRIQLEYIPQRRNFFLQHLQTRGLAN